MIVKEPATNLVNIHESSQASVPIEITGSEQAINEQVEIGPGRKEHFETFVRPSLSEDDDSRGANDMMEHKAIPSSLEKRDSRSTIEQANLIQRQIKGDILDMELDQKEEIVMSESLIQQQPNIIEQKENVTEASKTVDLLGDDITDGCDYADINQRKPSVNFELNVADENGLVEHIETSPRQPLSLEDAQSLASDFVESLTEQAIKVSEEIVSQKNSREDLVDIEQVVDDTNTVSSANREILKEVASEFIQDLNAKAIEITEKMTSASEVQVKQSEECYGEQSMIQSVIESKASKVDMQKSQISMEISDSDLKSDLNEMKSELREHIEELQSGTKDRDEIYEEQTEFEEGPIDDEIEPITGKDFKLISSFHTHYVTGLDPETTVIGISSNEASPILIGEGGDSNAPMSTEKSNTETQSSNQVQKNGNMTFSSEDIWAKEASSIKNRDLTMSSLKLRKSDNESNTSSHAGTISSGRQTSSPKSDNRLSGADFGGVVPVAFSSSSSGDNFYSARDKSPNTSSRSRPSSSDIDAMLSAVSGPYSSTVTTEYETAHSSYDVSGHSNISSSQDYHTAASSLPSKDSTKSYDYSESSGHLASYEISEASETLIDGSLEHDGERDALITPSGAPNDECVIEEEEIEAALLKDCEFEMVLDQGSNNKDIPSLSTTGDIKQLSESRETLNASIITISSGSDATVLQKECKEEQTGVTAIAQSILTPTEASKAKEQDIKAGEKLVDMSSLDKDPIPRVVSFEASVSNSSRENHEILKGQKSIDSEYGSRPESELKDFESRPQSTSEYVLSRSSSEDQRPVSKEGMSDPEVSSTLKVNDPFVRPITPEPPKKVVTKDTVEFSQEALEEAEIAFSKHFTQVVEESAAEFEKHEVGIVPEVQIMTAIEPTEETEKSPNTFLANASSAPQELKAVDKQPLSESKSCTGPEDVGEPAALISRPLGVSYWPPSQELNLEDDGSEPFDKRHLVHSESDDCSEIVCDETEREVEERRKWLDQQFDGSNEHQIDDNYSYAFNQPLDQIEEEDEDVNFDSDMSKLKESLNHSLDFEQIVTNKRQLAIRGERDDDSSMSSLQEFEKLEQDLRNFGSGSESRGSLGSQDSLDVLGNNSISGVPKPTQKKKTAISVADDTVSVDSTSSLKDFEHMEEACKEAENIEKKAKEQEDVLSEIEEGHESQYSESSDSCETLSEGGKSDDEATSDAFEQRLFQIDEIIKQAQTNVENFESPMKLSFNETLPLEEILAASKSPEEAKLLLESMSSNSDSLEVQLLPESCGKAGNAMTSSGIMQASIDSLDLKQKVLLPSDAGIMEISTDSIEGNKNTKSQSKTDPIDSMTFSTDSIEHVPTNGSNGKSCYDSNTMTQSVDSLEGDSGPSTMDSNKPEVQAVPCFSTKGVTSSLRDPFDLDTYLPPEVSLGSSSIMLQSTDSLESGSSNTRATASLLSSCASVTSETLLSDADQEAAEHKRSQTLNYAAKTILEQGAIKLSGDESDDSSLSLSLGSKQRGAAAAQFTAASFQQGPTVFQTTRIVDSSMTTQDAYTTKEDILLSGTSNIQGSGPSYCDEKMDTSVEESFEEVDEFGNKRKVIIKRSIEPINIVTSETIRSIHSTPPTNKKFAPETISNIVSERRTQQGLGSVEKSMFKK